jgi:choline dehydrogenase-like flavoprotein
MSKIDKTYDVVVVGSGPNGAWAAKVLADRGASVLVLEAGSEVKPQPRGTATGFFWRAKRILKRLRRRQMMQCNHAEYWELNPDLFIDDKDHPYTTPPEQPFHWIRSRQVGGRGLTWGGISVRLSERELLAPREDGFGEPWPITYEDLKPFYDQVEEFFGVHGSLEGLPQLPDGKFRPAMSLTTSEKALKRAVESRWSDRRVIPGRGVFVRPSARLGGEPLSPSALAAAVLTGRVDLLADSVVSHVTFDANTGKANGVAYVDTRTLKSREIRARAVVLCASTIETTRLLLNSASPQHPAGLGNSSDVLGRYLMDHRGIWVDGKLPGKRDELWNQGWAGPKSIMIPRFHNLQNKPGNFLRGFGIWGMSGRWPLTPERKAMLAENEVDCGFLGYGEMLPRAENRVTLNRDQKDRYGIPIPHIECKWSDNEKHLANAMQEAVKEVIAAGGGEVRGVRDISVPGTLVHEMGTARMGSDPRTSVVNAFNQVWDSKNVLVTDGACWTTGAWQNPTLTMLAITGRACTSLAEEMKRGNV